MPSKVNRYLARGGEKVEGEAGKEKVILEVKGIDTFPDRPTVNFEVNAPLTTELEGEETILRIRRNTVTGTEVAKVAEAFGASAHACLAFAASDSPGEVANMTYVLTAEQKKATKKDTFIFPTLEAVV